MKTTLGKIKSFEPDKLDWDKLCLVFGTEDNTEVTLLQILDNTGVLFAFWSLRCWDYIEYASLLADIVEHVAHYYDSKFPEDKTVRYAVETIRKFALGDATTDELAEAGNAAMRRTREEAAKLNFGTPYIVAWAAAWATADGCEDAASRTIQFATDYLANENFMRDFIGNKLAMNPPCTRDIIRAQSDQLQANIPAGIIAHIVLAGPMTGGSWMRMALYRTGLWCLRVSKCELF